MELILWVNTYGNCAVIGVPPLALYGVPRNSSMLIARLDFYDSLTMIQEMATC